MTLNDHITKVVKKITRASGILARIRHFVNMNALKLVYYALVYPFLIYGNLIWGNTNETRIQKILNVQKKIVRLMMFKSYSEHTKLIFQKLSFLDIFKLNDYLTALFMFRYHDQNNLPDNLVNCFATSNQIHQHSTRNSSKRHKFYMRTNYVKHTLLNKGIDIWNELEPKFKNIVSYYSFKRQIKEYFLLV